MIDLEEKYLQEIKRILKAQVPECEVRAYGSRINGTAKKFSDLDLAVVAKSPLDWRTLERLKEAFSDSDLPILVDVLNWDSIPVEFREEICQKYEVIAAPTNPW